MEVDKIAEVRNEARIISEFIDWLSDNDYNICVWRDLIRHSRKIGDYDSEGFYPKKVSNEQLLADFFNIDLEKVNREREELLAELRGSFAAATTTD